MKTFLEYVTTPGRPAVAQPGVADRRRRRRSSSSSAVAAGGQQRGRLVDVERPPGRGPAQRPPHARLGRSGVGCASTIRSAYAQPARPASPGPHRAGPQVRRLGDDVRASIDWLRLSSGAPATTSLTSASGRCRPVRCDDGSAARPRAAQRGWSGSSLGSKPLGAVVVRSAGAGRCARSARRTGAGWPGSGRPTAAGRTAARAGAAARTAAPAAAGGADCGAGGADCGAGERRRRTAGRAAPTAVNGGADCGAWNGGDWLAAYWPACG